MPKNQEKQKGDLKVGDLVKTNTGIYAGVVGQVKAVAKTPKGVLKINVDYRAKTTPKGVGVEGEKHSNHWRVARKYQKVKE